MYLWNTKGLALALSKQEVSTEEKFGYLIASNCIWVLAGYIGSVIVSPSGGLLFWYEGVLVLAVTYFGFQRCREKYEGATDGRLLENCVVLSVPLSIKFLAFTWLAYAAFAWGARWFFATTTLTFSPESAIVVDRIVKGIYTFYPFLVTAIGTLVYYLRLATHLENIARAKHGA